MDLNRLRFIMATIIIGGYVVIVGGLVLGMFFVDSFSVNDGIEIMEEVSKVMAGFIGLIIGYYFSRGQNG